MDIIQLGSVDSTNKYIKENYQTLKHFNVVTCKEQTKGKGRHVNQWFSNQDSLTFSILLKDNLDQKYLSILPLLMAKVLHELISQYTSDALIKWPNDIYVQNKKLLGILIESIYQTKIQAIIIGVGINLNNTDYPKDLLNQIISLKQVTHTRFSHDDFLKKIIDQFKANLHLLDKNPQIIIDYCNKYHLLNNQEITYEEHQTKQSGRCIKINVDGNLLIENKGQIFSLISGDVQKIKL